MTLRMGDAIFPNNIPVAADQLDAVAGYVGGSWPDYAQEVATWPSLKHLSIAVNSTEQADVLDVETGDATPADVPGWLARWQPGNTWKPVLYANAENIVNVVGAAGWVRSQYLIWSAHYTDLIHICGPQTCGFPQADATQWTDHGGVWDESLVNDNFFSGGNMPRTALPASAMPVKEVCATWAPDHSQWDVVMLGADGHPYHVWFIVGKGWAGPEDLTQAG